MERKMHRYVKYAFSTPARMCSMCGARVFRFYVCRNHGVVVCEQCRGRRKHRKCVLDLKEIEH